MINFLFFSLCSTKFAYRLMYIIVERGITMNLYTNILLSIIYITYPLLLFLFYVAYNRNYCNEENNLFLDVALISSFYMVIKFTNPIFSDFPPIIFNAILVIAYLKERKGTVLFLSIVSILCYTREFHLNIPLIIIEYIIYFLLYMVLRKKKEFSDKYINSFIIVKAFFFTLTIILSKKTLNMDYANFFCQILILILMLYLTVYFATLLFEKGEEIIKYHMSIKELKQEKQIHTSIFKIAHEIKNPIAVCKGYLDMFDTNNIEHSIKYIPILREEIERVLIILQDFLTMTKVKVEKEPMDIYLLIEDVVDSLKPIMKNKNIKLDLEIPDSELYIEGDYNRLKQVFINLIKNSVEAIPDNKVGNIKIYSKENNDNIEIFIEDNGIGMSKEVLDKIKDLFFTTKANGTGLGTSLCIEIVEAHGGKINYSSRENEGTVVSVMLNL